MSFTDTLKRSLGFEETESSNNQKKENTILNDIVANVNNFMKPRESRNQQPKNTQQQYRQAPRPAQNPQQQYRQAHKPVQNPNPRPTPKPAPVYDDFDDFVITPEQSFYEIVLIRPKTIDDINYVVDQVIEEKNPVILDLSFLEKESAPNFKLAGDKIKQMRARYGAQALLLSRTEDKNLIIISPKKVKVINKG